MTTLRAFCYIIAQLIGGITGAALARSVSITMFKGVTGGSNFVAAGVSTGSAFWIEMLGEAETEASPHSIDRVVQTNRADQLTRLLVPITTGTIFLVMAVLAATDTDRLQRWPHRRTLLPLEVSKGPVGFLESTWVF